MGDMIAILALIAVFVLAVLDVAGPWLWLVAGVAVLVWLGLAVAERRRSQRLGRDRIEQERTGEAAR